MHETVFLFNPRNQPLLTGKKVRYVPGTGKSEVTWHSIPLSLLPFLIFGVFGIYSYQADLERAHQIQQLSTIGVEVMGTVRSCFESRGGVSISYRYTLIDRVGIERTYSGSEGLGVARCRDYAASSPIEVLYLSQQPSISKLVISSSSKGVPIIWLLLAIFGFAFSAFGWISIVITEWRLYHLGFSGTLLKGQIVSSELKFWRKRYFIDAKYQFQVADGRVIEALERSTLSLTPLDIPPVGTRVWILYCTATLYRPL